MLRNYLVVAFRTLQRHRTYSAINIAGLGVSMAVGLLIVLFVRDQMRYDAFHPDADRVFRANVDFKSSFNADPHAYAMSPAALAGVLAAEVPGVERATRIHGRFGGAVSVVGGEESETLSLRGLYAEPSFFDVFAFPLARGDVRTALMEPNTVVLHDDTARRLFGDEDPVGRLVEVEGSGDFRVTGVMAPLPGKTHLPVEAVASLVTILERPGEGERLEDWTQSIYGWYTYLRLDEDARIDDVAAQMPRVIGAHFPPRAENRLDAVMLQGVTAVNFGPVLDNQIGGAVLPRFVAVFLLSLAGLVVVVACLNYVLLTLARAVGRTKEVGVRKAVGAGRRHLLVQFLVEALLFAGLSLVVACVLLVWLVPWFNRLWMVATLGVPLSLDPLGDPGLYLTFAGMAVGVALLAGWYPALRLTGVRMAPGLRRAAQPRRRRVGRRALVVVQVGAALLLVVTTTFVHRQASFMMEADYGFDKGRLVNVRLDGVPYEVVRTAVASTPGVEGVTATSTLPAVEGRRDVWVARDGSDETIKGYAYAVAPNYTEVYGIAVRAGRMHEAGRSADSAAVVLNEQAVAALGFSSPRSAVGERLTMFDATYEIVGVVADYRSNPLDMADTPLLLMHDPDAFGWATVRTAPGEAEQVAARIEAAYAALGRPDRPTVETFPVQISASPSHRMLADMRGVIGLVASLAVGIALLGLYGLAAFAAAARTKEVGIRKVLGASALDVVRLLTREFLLLVAVGLTLAAPLAWLLNRRWIESYAHRIEPGIVPIAASAALLLVLALVAVGVQTVAAARTDPARSLRYE